MDKDELIDIWREVVLKNTTNGSCNFQQAAIDFAELVAKPWVETNKAMANEIIELQKQAEQEPVAYLSPNGKALRPNEVTAGELSSGQFLAVYAAPVRIKDLTDDEIEAIHGCLMAGWVRRFARAVIAAYKEKNK